MVQMTRRTPAKVNLCLLVGPKDDAGYHEIFTVFAPVDVYDELEFVLGAHPGSDGPGALHVECDTATGEANLAAKALRALESHTGWAFTGRVAIRKGIPVGAGLGGGSSDAAAALSVGMQALSEAGGPVPDDAQLTVLARRLGADVAFFLHPIPSIGRGIGELLEPVALPELSLVLVVFDRMLSTARVYRTFDAMRPAENRGVFQSRAGQAEKRWRQVVDAGEAARLMENDLEIASFNIVSSLEADRDILVREGAMGAVMSGSGPTLLAVCASRAAAEALAERLVARDFRVQVATVAASVVGGASGLASGGGSGVAGARGVVP